MPELENLVLEIREIKKGLDKDLFQIARFGYICWIKSSREKPQIERIKFLRDYMKVYENEYRKRV
jgi:hypothetical protein